MPRVCPTYYERDFRDSGAVSGSVNIPLPNTSITNSSTVVCWGLHDCSESRGAVAAIRTNSLGNRVLESHGPHWPCPAIPHTAGADEKRGPRYSSPESP